MKDDEPAVSASSSAVSRYPLIHCHLLSLDNLKRLIVVIHIIPSGSLMRRVARPPHAKLVLSLRLWSVGATVTPGCRADEATLAALEAIHG